MYNGGVLGVALRCRKFIFPFPSTIGEPSCGCPGNRVRGEVSTGAKAKKV